MSFVLSGFLFFAAAQETLQNELKTAGYKTAFKHSGAAENWFFHIGAGGQVFLGDEDLACGAGLGNRFTLMPEVAIGKWFNPYLALRLKGQGGALHGFQKPALGKPDDAYQMQHFKYYNVHLDVMWNWANHWGVWSPSRTVGFGPYFGLGYARRLQDDNALIPVRDWNRNDNDYWPGSTEGITSVAASSDVISVNAGFNLGFNLSERIGLNFDLGATIVPDYFDRTVHLTRNEAIISLSGGIVFKLGKIGFETVELMDYALISDLNGKINDYRAENALLSKRPVACAECPGVVPTVTEVINYVPNVVFFRLNSDKIDANQQISIYNTSEFLKKTGEKIKVAGYADKATGASKYNLDISKRRAQAVAKELTTKYKIPTEKITVEWKGSEEQPYPHNNWNRVVIMSAPD